MTIYEFFSLMGGVGLFLYGMSIMSTGLKNAAGDKMKGILEHATSNRVIAIAVGLVVTLLIQSSSATDMMVISFVNSGMLSLIQAIGVIMGANIGTTITAQITAFNLGAYAPMILFIGAIMYLFLKQNTVKHVGSIIMGFGMLFFGISCIKSAIAPLSQSDAFISFLTTLNNPAVAIIFGVAFTALLQSSSSSVVIFQTFAVQGLITYEMTVYLVIGAAIGSVTPNILASLTTNRNGKRTAVLNLLFNLFRCFIMVALINIFPPFLELIKALSPDSIGHQVANTHTIFAILAVLIEAPFAASIVKLSEKIIPLREDENRAIEQRKLHYLVATNGLPSSVALYQARMEISRMGQIAVENLQNSIDCFFSQDQKMIDSVMETEETVDLLTDMITNKVVELRSANYGPHEQYALSEMMMSISDFERISDHAENIAEYASDLKNKKAVISATGMAELKHLAEVAMKSVYFCTETFYKDDPSRIPEAEKLEQAVDDLQETVINSHIHRLMEVHCDPMGGVIFTDIATDLERCSDHAINIATSVADEGDNN